MIISSDKLVIILYPSGIGGKLIANSLAMSNNSVLQHWDYAVADINGTLSVLDKFNILNHRIQQELSNMAHNGKAWRDLGLGCCELYGEQLMHPPWSWCEQDMSETTRFLNKSGKYHFLMQHQEKYVVAMLPHWPDVHLVLMENLHEYQVGHRIFSKSKPYSTPLHNRKNTHQFQHSVLHSDFLDHIQQLADSIGITGLDIVLVEKYYKLWKQIAVG